MQRSLGLNKFLIFWALVSISCAAFAIASAGDKPSGTDFLMILGGISALGASIGLLTGNTDTWISFLFLMAVFSHGTTTTNWTYVYPIGEVVIEVIDEKAMPIPGATFTVIETASGSKITSAMLQCPGIQSSRTDNEGRMICQQRNRGLAFAGERFLLFWCIPIGSLEPSHLCQVVHDGFVPHWFPFSQLFETPTGVINDDLPVYKRTIIMQDE